MLSSDSPTAPRSSARYLVPTVVLLLVLSPGIAHARSWWPVANEGTYCGLPGKETAGPVPRDSRDAPVRVKILGSGLQVRVGSQQKTYHRGEAVHARVENVGTTFVFDVRQYQVEWFREGIWQLVGPRELAGTPSPPPILSPGRARCVSFGIPRHARLGLYRISKELEYRQDAADERSKLMVSLQFRVSGEPGVASDL